MSRKRLTHWAAFVAIPVLPVAVAFVLWLASGREMFTKHWRVVSATVTDDLFGDTEVVRRFVPGPIFGYYVGLDLVIGVAILSMAIAATVAVISWLLNRRRAARRDAHEGAIGAA